MEKEVARTLRLGKSYYQKIAPHQRVCDGCPHACAGKIKPLSKEDGELFNLEEPHICHTKRDGLCRGVTEKMIQQGIVWKLFDEKESNNSGHFICEKEQIH